MTRLLLRWTSTNGSLLSNLWDRIRQGMESNKPMGTRRLYCPQSATIYTLVTIESALWHPISTSTTSGSPSTFYTRISLGTYHCTRTACLMTASSLRTNNSAAKFPFTSQSQTPKTACICKQTKYTTYGRPFAPQSDWETTARRMSYSTNWSTVKTNKLS